MFVTKDIYGKNKYIAVIIISPIISNYHSEQKFSPSNLPRGVRLWWALSDSPNFCPRAVPPPRFLVLYHTGISCFLIHSKAVQKKTKSYTAFVFRIPTNATQVAFSLQSHNDKIAGSPCRTSPLPLFGGE